MQKAPAYALVFFVLTFGLGLTGDLAGCSWIQLPGILIPPFTACHYVAILVASLGFGLEIGLGAAAFVGVAHATANMAACSQSISQQGEVVGFIVFGLAAGLLVRKLANSENVFYPGRQAEPGEHARDDESHNLEKPAGGTIPIGFVRAVRAPLSAIESAGYVLEDSALRDANRPEVASIILRECHRLDVLVRSLEAAQTRLPSYQEVDLSTVLDEVIRSGGALAEAACITLRRAEDLHLMVVCDAALLEQAVLNLLANAVQLAAQGDEIVLSAYGDKDSAVIEISNRRIGVLGQVGITMAVVPEGAHHPPTTPVEDSLKPQGGD